MGAEDLVERLLSRRWTGQRQQRRIRNEAAAATGLEFYVTSARRKP